MKDIIIKSGKANQIKNAFNVIQNLYHESSYLIREIKGLLSENERKFQLFSDGDCICSRTSIGLEPKEVSAWALRKFAVAFVEKSMVNLANLDDSRMENLKLQNGLASCTKINENFKMLYLRFLLDAENQSEPQLIFGVFYDIKFYKDWVKKRGNILIAIEYADDKLFAQFPNVDYENDILKLKGKLKKVNLSDIKKTDKLIEKVVIPAIQMYDKQ
ncbi:MAG: hypothetical protein LBU83_05760 [Bacteroidales bacterium]|jgi:hypothetical protein|nr:hypothetical protein [Bacteroidales bacterium]